MWLCIPEGKPIWQVKSLQRGEPVPEQWTKQNHPDKSKRHGRVKSHWQGNLNWQDSKLEKGLLKICLNLAVILYILPRGWGWFTAFLESHKQEQIDNIFHLMPYIILYIFKIKLCNPFETHLSLHPFGCLPKSFCNSHIALFTIALVKNVPLCTCGKQLNI